MLARRQERETGCFFTWRKGSDGKNGWVMEDGWWACERLLALFQLGFFLGRLDPAKAYDSESR